MSRAMGRGAADAAPRHLLFKGLVGVLLGFPLALWLSWLVMYGGALPGRMPVRDQLAMWLAVLLWGTVPCLTFLTSSRRQCLAVLVGANLAALLAWVLLR